MKSRNSIFFVSFLLLCTSFIQLQNHYSYPSAWPKPVYDFSKNPMDSATITLGRMLFYDPVLSADSSISCASCHSPYNAFAHVDHKLSHGIYDRVGIRNAPALMNLAWQPVFMMDGAVNHLDVQALAPITNKDEMASSIQEVVLKLKRSSFYSSYFKQTFGSSKITGERTLKALTQFMLSLQSSNSKFDQVERGELEFTPQERRGYKLFQVNCASCHQPPLFTTFNFENNGLDLDPNLRDTGRQKITEKQSDSLFFKVPTLRNISYTFPYMHDGRFSKLSDVVAHYAHLDEQKIRHTSIKNSMILSADDQVDLVSFLLTLNDKSFVFNTNYTYPKKIFDAVRGVKP